MYKRDVTAEIQGPSKIRVGEEVSQPSGYNSSANAMAVWVSPDSARATVGRETGLVRGIAAGDVVITATPSSTTTGTGRLISGAIRITVME